MKIAGERSRFAGKMKLPKRGTYASRADWNRWLTRSSVKTRRDNVVGRGEWRFLWSYGNPKRRTDLPPLHIPTQYTDLFRR